MNGERDVIETRASRKRADDWNIYLHRQRTLSERKGGDVLHDERDEADEACESDDDMNPVQRLFDKHSDEYLEFERIPAAERRHVRPDLCGMLYLHDLLAAPGDVGRDAVAGAEHDVIYLRWEGEELAKLTDADVIYLHRCGVRYDAEAGSLAMFV